MSKKISLLIGLCACVLILAYTNCSDKTITQSSLANSPFFFKTMTEMLVEVYYESNAQPFVRNFANTFDLWNITEQNLIEVFKNRSVNLIIPKSLNDMILIPDQNKSVWTTESVLNLANQYQVAQSFPSQGRFKIFFLNGYAADNSGNPNPNTIGFQISGTTVTVIFKDVVRATGVNPSGFVPRYVEQSTVIHELAHALGFVNNGLPIRSPHHDSANGAHCTNTNCVMHYLNEGAADLANFVQKYQDTQSPVMFGQECLDDAQNF